MCVCVCVWLCARHGHLLLQRSCIHRVPTVRHCLGACFVALEQALCVEYSDEAMQLVVPLDALRCKGVVPSRVESEEDSSETALRSTCSADKTAVRGNIREKSYCVDSAVAARIMMVEPPSSDASPQESGVQPQPYSRSFDTVAEARGGAGDTRAYILRYSTLNRPVSKSHVITSPTRCF